MSSGRVTAYLVLWGFVLLSGFLSEPPLAVSRAAGVLLLAGLALMVFGRCLRSRLAWRDALLAAVVLLGAAGTLAQAEPSVLFAAMWSLGIVALAQTPGAEVTAGAIAASGILGTILLLVPSIWNAVQWVSVSLTTYPLSWAGGGGLGASSSGLILLVLLGPIFLSTVSRQSRRWLLWPGVTLLLFLAYSAAGAIGAPAPKLRLVGELLYVATLLAIAVAGRQEQTRRKRLSAWRGAFMLPLVAYVLSGLLVSLPGAFPGQPIQSSRTILFVDQTLLGSWQTPKEIEPGGAFSGATFGLFPEYLEAYGHHVTRSEGLPDSLAAEVDLVIVINPGAPFTDAQVSYLHAFVEEGGAVLILGDHTNMGGIMDAANGVAAPLGLSLAFDSAVSLAPGWPSTLRMSPPLSVGTRPLEVPVSVGASVAASVNPAVEPFLVGRRAFADPGEEENTARALLGNLVFDRGERYGDVILAAVRHYGLGKVALFGDTSPFQNSALALSSSFADRLVRWLTERTGEWRAVLLIPAALLLLLMAGLVVRHGSSVHAAILAIVVAGGMLSAQAWFVPAFRAEIVSSTEARIDVSHGNLIGLEPLDLHGLEGLSLNLARAGLLPIVRFDKLTYPAPSPEGVMVSMASTQTFTPREQEQLLSWVESGGRLIMTTGWPNANELRPFLEPLGIVVRPVPLGMTRPDVGGLDQQPQLPSAWPLETSDAWQPLGTIEWDGTLFTVAALREYGAGWVIVVGDNNAFSNANLEGKSFAYIENIAFLESLLSELRGRASP